MHLEISQTVRCVFILESFRSLIAYTVNGWSNGFGFVLSFLAPLWTICELSLIRNWCLLLTSGEGSFDSCVHISEEASNASVVVPWAIVGAISIAGVLGWGMT